MKIDSPEFRTFIATVKTHYGKPLDRLGDFKRFTEEVNEQIKGTGQISESTVKRLFQHNSQTNFQDSTLDLIARYMGKKDLFDVIESSEKTKDAPASKYYSHSLSVGKLKLHDAMIKVLNDAGTSLSPETLAQRINEQGLYERNDRQPLPASQILQRVEVRPLIFSYDKENNLVILDKSHRKPESEM